MPVSIVNWVVNREDVFEKTHVYQDVCRTAIWGIFLYHTR